MATRGTIRVLGGAGDGKWIVCAEDDAAAEVLASCNRSGRTLFVHAPERGKHAPRAPALRLAGEQPKPKGGKR